MPTDPVDLLDRQYDRLQQQDDAAFVHELKNFHGFVTAAGPDDVTGAMRELREDAERIERAFTEHDEQLLPDLVALKAELVKAVPETNDSALPRPQTDLLLPPMGWAYTLANFDQMANGGADRFMVANGHDQSRSGMLLRILENRVRRLQFSTNPSDPATPMSDDNLRPDLDGLRREMRNLGDRHRHAVNLFASAIETHGGVQIQVLDWAVDEMNPAPVTVVDEDDEHALTDQVFRRITRGTYALEAAAIGQQLSEQAERSLAYNVELLKAAADKVHEAVRLKVATAPTTPAPTPDYGQRLQGWVLSPGYALVGGPCISGVITQFVQSKSTGVVLFLVLAFAAAGLPPLRSAPPALTFTRVSLSFIIVACAAVVIALAAGSLGAAFLVFLLTVVAFGAGDYTGRHRTDS